MKAAALEMKLELIFKGRENKLRATDFRGQAVRTKIIIAIRKAEIETGAR